jgi:hypothetical protein
MGRVALGVERSGSSSGQLRGRWFPVWAIHGVLLKGKYRGSLLNRCIGVSGEKSGLSAMSTL